MTADLLLKNCLILACVGGLLCMAGAVVSVVREKAGKKRTGAVTCEIVGGIALLVGVIFLSIVGLTEDQDAEPEVPAASAEVGTATYEEIYRAYKENELRADDEYKNNRYEVTAKINGMETGGLFNLTGGATLTMEIQIDNTIVIFYAEFEKEQEDALKTVNVGDTITFEGECLSAGSWIECELK